jgi:DnaK suppressor protein
MQLSYYNNFLNKKGKKVSYTTKDLEKIKSELLVRRRELEEKLDQMSKEKVSDDQVQDPGDQALSSTMELLKSSFEDAEIQEIKRIERALQKIEDGSYGICADCGEQISEKRLKSNPNAARCLACQEAYEEQL